MPWENCENRFLIKNNWIECTKNRTIFVGNGQNDCWLFNRFEYNKLKILNPWKDLWNFIDFFIDLTGHYVVVGFWTFDWDIWEGQQVRTSQTDFGRRHLRQAAGKDIKDGHRVKTSETDMIRKWECLSGNQNRKGGKRNG